MGKEDWYRRTIWDESNQEAFFEKLNRSRGLYKKSQYTRIQAFYLEKAGLAKDALQLLDRLYNEWPDESQLACAYSQEANCHLLLKNLDSAVSAYRKCFEAEEKSNFRHTTNARVEYLWLVATRKLKKLYDEALEEIDKMEHPSLFPLDQYRVAGALALINFDSGRLDNVPELAAKALEAASKTDSGLRYHKGLGLVMNPDRKIIRRLKKLAAARM